MIGRWIAVLMATILAVPAAAQADTLPDPRAVVERGVAAHGGDVFLDPGTLTLVGEAVFYSAETGQISRTADDYRMWRAFEPGRREAHGADGKVRIMALSDGATVFAVGYDGETTWTERGIMPQEQADAYWASNFGFGIIRSALDDGFTLQRAPSRDIGGHAVDIVRIIDAGGQPTLFGFDAASGLIRYMAFTSPRGFHERIYDDFVRLPDSGWVQARVVTLLYDGVVNNIVNWRDVAIGAPLDPQIFAPPEDLP